MFSLADLEVPIIGAPMAGGPSTPALVAAVAEAGGLGFLPAGYLTVEKFAESITATRRLTSGPIGVNLFVPQPCMATDAELQIYRELLMPLARRYGVEPGVPHPDDDGWAAKLDVVADIAPEVASFTFGCPTREEIDRLRQSGVLSAVTVTSREEAIQAIEAGADVVVAQGPEAGGHRSAFGADRPPPTVPLDDLLAAVVDLGVPVVAAGGIGDRAAVRRVLDAGAAAAQVGTALLLCEEAGTNPAHRRALRDEGFNDTIVTPCFSGRYARSLANEFTDRYHSAAPMGYPQLHQITGPIRAAAIAAGDAQFTSLWAGTSWRGVETGTAAQIIAALTGR